MGERLTKLLTWVHEAPAELSAAVAIPSAHVDFGDDLSEPFRSMEHYFTVRINEMFLAQGREWFVSYVPTVFALTEFTYDKDRVSVPLVVGPKLIEATGQKLPDGMLIRDTRVAGAVPYSGDKLTITMILNRVVKTDHAAQLLDIVKSVTDAFGMGVALGPYLQVAQAVRDGMESLLGLGSEAVLGVRHEIDTNAGDVFRPGFSALLSTELEPPDMLWVRNRRLYAGPDEDNLRRLRDRDYVLYSVTRTSMRDDVESMAWFVHLWERVVCQARRGSEDGLRSALDDFTVLAEEIYLSPDLTRPQKLALIQSKRAEISALHEAVVSGGHHTLARCVHTQPGALSAEDLEILSGIGRAVRDPT